ncbi:hypothetical protein FPZ22_07045 [Luteimonas granuli]|uniref:Uncharacterized protein n=1 Tax=Luteimonas granuli TaxID=1176533 RepID=A0A518N454_9GAMM|nr:hypothetical protein FPZ22_07045 [Luteimonas granuli]
MGESTGGGGLWVSSIGGSAGAGRDGSTGGGRSGSTGGGVSGSVGGGLRGVSLAVSSAGVRSEGSSLTGV